MRSYPILKRSTLLLATMGLTVTEANAGSLDSLYVVPGIYYASPDSRLAADHDFGVQLSIGANLSRQWLAELISEATKFKRDDRSDTYKQLGASIQAVFSPLNDFPVRPLLIGGTGWLHTSTRNADSSNRPLIRAGAGLQWDAPNASWGIRGTATWRHEFNSGVVSPSSDLNTYIYSLGVSYRFGGTHSSPPDQAESSSTAPSAVVPAPASEAKPVAATPPA